MLSPEKKKVVIYSVIFSILALLIIGLGFLVHGVMAKGNHDEARYGVHKIRLSGWREPHMTWARETLPSLSRLGPSFQIVETGENVVVLNIAQVTSFSQCSSSHAVAFQSNRPIGSDGGVGESRIVIDPVCTRGEFEFKAAFAHEVGHSLGMRHVCRSRDNLRLCPTNTPLGRAVMNPSLVYDNDSADSLGEDIGAQPTWEIQDLDIQEFCRVRGCN
jgi:hypothetical protein